MGSKKKAKKKIEKYYDSRKDRATGEKDTKKDRLSEDLAEIMRLSGIATDRAMDNYIKNAGRIDRNEGVDLEGLDQYVETQSSRTQEDLDTSLAKEFRRFDLESDQINQNLAASGMTFSERTQEQIARGNNNQNNADIDKVAERSFTDIANYETAKSKEIENKYGDLREDNETTKNQTLEDILNAQTEAQRQNSYGVEDADTDYANTMEDLGYAEDTDKSGIEVAYDTADAIKKNTKAKNKAVGA